MNNFFQIVSAVAILALGIWIGTLFNGCGTKRLPALHYVDTLVIDTSKIIEHTPITVNSIKLVIHDTLTCDAFLPPTVLSGGDTLSVGRMNSCKGIFENIRLSKKPDTVFYDAAKIIRDTVRESFEFPSPVELASKALNFNVRAKAGSGFGMFLGLGFDGSLEYDKIGLLVSPSLYFIKELRGFVSILLTYKLLGK